MPNSACNARCGAYKAPASGTPRHSCATREITPTRFAKGERIDLYNTERIVAITPQTLLKLPYQGGHEKYTYVVTALDRLQNESKGKKVNVKL